jgi:hypothetical protein
MLLYEGGFMMKKFLILLLVLAMASWANAVPTLSIVSGGNSAVNATKGSTINVDVVSDTACTNIMACTFTEDTASTAGHSTSAVGSLHTGFDGTTNSVGGSVDTAANFSVGPGADRYILVHRVNGGILTGSPSIAAGQKLYKDMQITLPALASVGDTFTIDFATGYKTVGSPPAYTLNQDGVAPNSNALVITIVPEPMTLVLLGLGGLFLRRRK